MHAMNVWTRRSGRKACLGVCTCAALLVFWQAVVCAEDFPSMRGFGRYFVVAGGSIVQTPRLMGPTGAIGWIHGREVVVREVEGGSPADGVLRPGDVVLKANGHGLGADPRMGLGHAITESEAGDGKLRLRVYRDGRELDVAVQLRPLGPYARTWPFDCKKSRKLLDIFCDHLASIQQPDGGYRFRTPGAANALVLLANPEPKYVENCRRFAYGCVRDKANMGGLGTWPTSYTGIYLAEYYLVTGDRQVLPELERVCRILAEGQQPCGSWGHGATINRYYAVGGLLNQCGLTAWLALVLGRECGVKVDPQALDRAARFFRRFADRGNVPYGDHRPWDGRTGNGKDAIAAVTFDLLGDGATSRIFADQIAAYYPHRELGHTGPYFGILWGPLGALRASRREDFRRFLDYWTWYYDLARSWEGGGLLLLGDTYLKRGFRFCTGAIAMPCALSTGQQRLRIMGAPKSVFAAGQRSPGIQEARQLFFRQQWTEMKDLLEKQRLTGDDARFARQLRDAAAAAQKSVELTLAAVEDNLRRRWHPQLAKRQLEDLRMFLAKADPRVEKLLDAVTKRGNLAAIEKAKKTYEKYVRLSQVDDTARQAMEGIARDPRLGYLSELARQDLESPHPFRRIFTLEDDWYRFLHTWKADPLAFKGFRQIATTWGGNWPTREAKKHMRAAGFLLHDKETLAEWEELVPITDKQGGRGKPKTARVLFLPRERAFEGPMGWHLPGFDDSGWQEGQFPIGTSHGNRSTTHLPAGMKALCARVRFRLDDVSFARLRLLHRLRHLCNVYLNGYLVGRVLYQGNEGGYGTVYQALDLHPDTPHLIRKGENVLALEGAYDLWWGIFDVGLYGVKGKPSKPTRPIAPPPATTQVAPEPGDARFTPKDVWRERQDAMDKQPVGKLIQQLESPSVHVRGHAARSLAKKGKAATPALVEALRHPHWHVRRGACDAIRFMEKDAAAHAADALPALVNALDDGDFYVRDGAALALAAIGQVPDPAVPKLVRMLNNPDHWWPREAAVRALGGRAAGLLPALLARYHKTTNVRTELTLRQAICRYVTKELADDVVAQVVRLTREDDDWTQQRKMLELIKKLGAKARRSAPFVKALIQKIGEDKKKGNYLRSVLKAITPRR